MSRYKENRWDVKCLYGLGGMFFFYFVMVMGFVCVIGFCEGFGGFFFVIVFVLVCIVCIFIFGLLFCYE